jgi:ATP-dependent protease ClpP protease subunit
MAKGKKIIHEPNYNIDHTLKAKSEDPLYHLHEYDVDLKSNHIYLMGIESYNQGNGLDGQEPGIEYIIANRFIRNFNLLMRVNPNVPILVHMKTNGGFWEEGMAIYDTIKSCPWYVTILNYTHARSMSSIIFQAANKRVMMPNSSFMFHDGTFGIEGTQKQVYSAVQFNKIADKTMLDIYANMMNINGEFKGQGVTKIKTWLRSQMDRKEDVYLTAPEAVKLGLADEVFNYDWASLTVYNEEQESR